MELGFLVLNGVVCQDYLPRTETHQITQFANCGCKDACNCVVSNGDTTTVTGSGSAVDPYIVEVKPNTASITVEDTDCIDLNGSGTPTDPVNATLIISPDADNLLVRPASGCTANGLKISCNDVTDCITVGDCLEIVGGILDTKIASDVGGGNGIECTPDGLLVAPSSDTDNSIVYGSDGNLYVPQGECVAVPMEVEIDLTGGSSCLSATGGGCVGDPYVLTLGLAADPNGLDCVASGLQVIPSTDAGNSMIFGTDGRLFTPTPFVEVLDTDTVDMTLTGTGTSGDPFILSSCVPAVIASNTSCITLTVLKGGVGCQFPYVISATPVISPDPCNGLECRPNGLFSPQSEDETFGDRIDVCTTDLGGIPTPLPPTGRVTVIPMQQITVTNPSDCRDMLVQLSVDFPQTIMSFTNGDARVIGMISEDGLLLLADAVSQRAFGAPTQRDHFESMHTSRLQAVLPPGGSATYQAQLDVLTNGISPGGTAEGCISMSVFGHLV